MITATGAIMFASLALANEEISIKEVEGADAIVLAKKLLPANVRADVVEGVVRRQFLPGNVYWVGYLTKPRRIANDLCARKQISVQLRSKTAKEPGSVADTQLTVGGIEHRELRALIISDDRKGESGCPAKGGYISFDGTQTDVGRFEAYRTLARVIMLAQSSNPLNFELTCEDEQSTGVCAKDGRRALASLDLKELGSIQPVYNTSCIRVVFAYPDDHCPASITGQERMIEAWQITLPYAAGEAFSWTVGLAPRTGSVTHIQLKRGMIIYH